MSIALIELLGAVAVALLAGLLGGGAVVVGWQQRKITQAAAEGGEIANLRAIIDEVRAESERRGATVERLERRVGTLEERERHMLTRAAVHEAWDQFAFAALVAQNPAHPAPPPLTELEDTRA